MYEGSNLWGTYSVVDIYSMSSPETTPSPFVFSHKQPSVLTMSLYSLQLWHNLHTCQNKRLQQLYQQTHSSSEACLTAPSQCTMELCWHGPAWGMGRSEVYDCADVNDIIQILNQAACFQPFRSCPLATSLENLTWIAAAEQSNHCRQEWSGLTNDWSNVFWLSVCGQLSVCVSTHPSVYHYFKCDRVHFIISNAM